MNNEYLWNGYSEILRGTSRVRLCFGNDELFLDEYIYAYVAGDSDSKKSISRFLMTVVGQVASWQSRLQKCIVPSTTKIEYIAQTDACKENCGWESF